MDQEPISHIVKKVARVVCLTLYDCQNSSLCNEHLADFDEARQGRCKGIGVHKDAFSLVNRHYSKKPNDDTLEEVTLKRMIK